MENEKSPSLLERRRNVSLPVWGEGYGGVDDGFELTKYHDGYYLDGNFRGEEVEDVIDLFHGVLSRNVRPDHPRIQEAEWAAGEVGVTHVGKTDTHELIVEFQERLQKAYEGLGLGSARVLFDVTGSGANSRAYRLASAYTRGGKPFYLDGCYHGNDYLGNATVGLPPWRGKYSPKIEGVRHLPHGEQGSESLRAALKKMTARGYRSFMSAEDIQGIGGFINPGEEFLTDAVQQMGENGGVFINDEVQTGMRRGSYLSVPRWLKEDPSKVKAPVMITLAKALANGEPLACTLVPEAMAQDLAEDLERDQKLYGKHWATYDSNVRSCAIGSAVHDIYHDEDLGERTLVVREAFLRELEQVTEDRGDVVKSVRGDGLMIGIQLQTAEQATYCLNNCIAFGVRIGIGGDTLRIAPLADTPLDIVIEAGERVAKLLDSAPRK
ncbi:MAG: aminotransferase class III-fold pyridoxal phosphate-dependent enzyme [Candidatus Gracilibacteria bacterium]